MPSNLEITRITLWQVPLTDHVTYHKADGKACATGLAMKIDESADDIASLHKAYQLGYMDAVALKLLKFGGLSALRRAHDLCLHSGASMCIEDCWGSDIATAAALHQAAASKLSALLNVCERSGCVMPRLESGTPQRTGGAIAPPDDPGLGIEIDVDRLGTPIAIFS